MRKNFAGIRLRALRAERGLSQSALAQALDLSPSYLNQIEQNHRPLTVAVMLKLRQALGVEVQQFSGEEEMRLLSEMRSALADMPGGDAVSLPELQEVASQMPAFGRLLLDLHRRNQETLQRLEAMSVEVGDGRGDAGQMRVMPFDAVLEFFLDHNNYFDGLDRAAEALAAEARTEATTVGEWLIRRLRDRHGVRLEVIGREETVLKLRQYDPGRRVLRLSETLEPGQQAFHLAAQLALLELHLPIEELVHSGGLNDEASRVLGRIGLANYVAAAFVLPYTAFLEAAERLRYDIDQLGRAFGAGFETVCQRLSTLQRADKPGVPFFFVRLDRAGNISKRQSATHFHFSRTGGTCPLWKVYEAFAQPGRILRQVARMPDGRVYLWIARTVSRGVGGFGSPNKTFSIGLGCDVRHASRLIYSRGLDVHDVEGATPIGMGCKVCERPDCPQRAFPSVAHPLDVNENESRFSPYVSAIRPRA